MKEMILGNIYIRSLFTSSNKYIIIAPLAILAGVLFSEFIGGHMFEVMGGAGFLVIGFVLILGFLMPWYVWRTFKQAKKINDNLERLIVVIKDKR